MKKNIHHALCLAVLVLCSSAVVRADERVFVPTDPTQLNEEFGAFYRNAKKSPARKRDGNQALANQKQTASDALALEAPVTPNSKRASDKGKGALKPGAGGAAAAAASVSFGAPSGGLNTQPQTKIRTEQR